MNVPLSWYLLVAAALFCIGLYGTLSRRNAVGILMSIELMLNAANILFVAFFPHLVAGPIVRYATVAEELVERRTRFDDLTEGCLRFALGLVKKVVIADSGHSPLIEKPEEFRKALVTFLQSVINVCVIWINISWVMSARLNTWRNTVNRCNA